MLSLELEEQEQLLRVLVELGVWFTSAVTWVMFCAEAKKLPENNTVIIATE
jgi:hypothetical protein